MPADLIAGSENFREQCRGFSPPLGIWAHICGSDLVRDSDGTIYVLEDNLRIPSGVSYMLENRQVIKRVFPELFEDSGIQPVDEYPARLFDTPASLSPRPAEYPNVVVLTPGAFNSAYFEHAWLAQQMGVELVEGRDLVVYAWVPEIIAEQDGCNWMIPVDDPTPFCLACRLNQVIPNLDKPGNRELWLRIEKRKRRPVYDLRPHRLPVVPRSVDPDNGLAFAFLEPVPVLPDSASAPEAQARQHRDRIQRIHPLTCSPGVQ